jgi:hypothetical protein
VALGFRMRSETTKEPTAAIIGINMMALLLVWRNVFKDLDAVSRRRRHG